MNFLKDALLVIISTILATISSVFIQTKYMSKYEENALIQTLIPSLISGDPRQIDISLMLLNETLSDSKYQKIKNIIDKQIENQVDKAMNQKKASHSSGKRTQENPPKDLFTVMTEYASAREEWNSKIKKRLIDQTKPLSKEEFLDYVDRYRKQTIDKILKEIAKETARVFNNKNCVSAFAGASWLAKQTSNEDDTKILLGIVKICSPEQNEKILTFYVDDGLKQLLFRFEGMAFLSLNDDSAGAKLNFINNEVLKDLKSGKLGHSSEYKKPHNDLLNVK